MLPSSLLSRPWMEYASARNDIIQVTENLYILELWLASVSS